MPNFSGRPPRGGSGQKHRGTTNHEKFYNKYDKDKVPASARESFGGEKPARRYGSHPNSAPSIGSAGSRPQRSADKPAYGDRPPRGPSSAGVYQDRAQRSTYDTKPYSGAFPDRKPRHANDRERFEAQKRGTPPPKFDKKPNEAFPEHPERTGLPIYAHPVKRVNARMYPPAPPPHRPNVPVGHIEIEHDEIDRSMLIVGRNPIREALRAGRDFEKIMIAEGDLHGSAHEIIQLAKEHRVITQTAPRIALDKMAPQNQGMIGIASAYKYSTVDDILANALAKQEKPFVIILDGITDPHNLGAIIRTAECAGAHGVIVPERRAVGLTSAAMKASAGAAMHLPVARVVNIAATLDQLKSEGLWIAAATQDGSPYDKADLSGALAIVIGSEGAGISRLVLDKCDLKVALPMRGKTESLNASVAAGILIYETVKRRAEE
jgi:23S rRNA (guanosine2251-2'-O)-methyltransferase